MCVCMRVEFQGIYYIIYDDKCNIYFTLSLSVVCIDVYTQVTFNRNEIRGITGFEYLTISL